MSRRDLWNMLFLLLVGLMIGLVGFLILPRVPVNPDAVGYFTSARNLLLGKGLVTSLATVTPAYLMGAPNPDLHMPGYPLLLAGFMWLTRTGIYSPVLLNIFLAVASAILVYFTVLLWSDRGKAIAASLLFLFFPAVLIYEFTGLAEMALVFWVMLSLFLASAPGRFIPRFIGAGLTLLIAYITRETTLLFVPLVVAILVERGARGWSIMAFTVVVLGACLASPYFYYLHWPGFAETHYIFAGYTALFRTGVLRENQNPMMDIVTRHDMFAGISPVDLTLLLLKKPFRLITTIWGSKSWITVAMDAWSFFAILLAPLVARGRWMRLGLVFAALIIPAMFTLYKPTSDYFMRITMVFALVAIVFVVIWIKRSTITKILLGVAIPVEFALGVLGAMNYQEPARIIVDKTERIEEMLAGNLPAESRIIGIRGAPLGTYCLRHPDVTTVFYPREPGDALLLNERLGTDALVFASSGFERIQPYPGLEALGWQQKVLIYDGDTVFVFTRKGE